MRLKNDSVMPGTGIGLMLAILTAHHVYSLYNIELTITSLNDSTHSATSLHYADQAVDLRIRNIPASIGAGTIADEIRQRLNKHYDVILEERHIHIEYQPRHRHV